ncbi:helix-turn-helix domain-containing protein [Paenibacillus thermoaerophilus]|uniref:Helix-turn-helix domain-containing protein n=1 Tax=Paenibacillus thermoaerophilus TaxID=1215385 RepID=A0ABW2UY88_9BACL|nr:AraC family transcriptional regulator [Paenibacillus thermoaerophilus]TMV17783.1 helix-turn-helix domain-containing protein [Paenibacillus thermoaerophilus]
MRASAEAPKPLAFDRWYLDRAMTLGAFTLEQVRDCCIRKGRNVWIDRTEGALTLLYALSGETTLSVGERQLPFAARQYALMQPGDRWKLVSAAAASARILSVRFRPAMPDGPYGRLLAARGEASAEPAADDGRLEDLLLGLVRELEAPDVHARTMAESYMLQLGVRLLRDRTRSGAANGGTSDARKAGKSELVYETIRYLDENLERIRELGELAAAIGYSYSHLSHVFRLEMGESLQSYWTGRRALRAMKLLQTGRTSVTQIAEMLHYQSIHSFSKAFKKVTGLTPSEYQELYGPPSEHRWEEPQAREGWI